jgi:putative DNA primase/helicase
MMTKLCNCEYDVSDKKPEKWLKFLEDITNGDKELEWYLQKCIGYSLSGSTREQCAFFLYGIGNNGKSTFIETIADMLGDYASNAQPETIMMNRNSGIGSDVARLKSARLVTSEEPTEGVRLNEGLVKQLTGGGKVTCRFLFGDEFEYTPEFKIWVATNHKPVIRGTDVGIWRRIRLIPFEVNIPPEKVDKNLKYKFRNEMPQILHWAVEGCMAWQREGIEPPQKVVDATQEYKAEMDLLATFMDSCITIDYTAEGIPAHQLYNVYTRWAETNKEYVMTSRKFFVEIGKKIPDKKRISSGILYQHIKLTEYAQDNFVTKPLRMYTASQFKQM